MSNTVILVEIMPRRPSDGEVLPLRLIGGSTIRADHMGQQWLPFLARAPRITSRLGFDGHSFGEGAVSTVGDIAVSLGSDKLKPFENCVYADATARIYSGPARGKDEDFTLLWQGRAADATINEGSLVVRLADPAEDLQRPVLAESFKGTGGEEGPAELKGRPKPRGFGICENVPAILLDQAAEIYFITTGAATITAVKDGGLPYAEGPVATSYSQLQSMTVPAGSAATLSTADMTLVRPWTRPRLTLTADIVAGSAAPGAIMEKIVTERTDLTFLPQTVADFDTQAPDCGSFIVEDRPIAEELDRFCAGLGGWWKLISAGQIALGRFDFGKVQQQAFSHQVSEISRNAILMPTRARKLGYRRNFRPLSDSEIAGALKGINWRGDYKTIDAYAIDDAVHFEGQAFIATAVTNAGESPSSSPQKWSLLAAAGAEGPQGPQGPAGPQGVPGPKGDDGQTLYTWVAYADSADGTANFTTGVPDSRKYIGLANNKTSPTESQTPGDYVWSKFAGDDGVPGSPGADGQPTYTWFAYADSADGTVNFTTGAPGGRKYIGIAPNKLSQSESSNPADYTWSLFVGADSSGLLRNGSFEFGFDGWGTARNGTLVEKSLSGSGSFSVRITNGPTGPNVISDKMAVPPAGSVVVLSALAERDETALPESSQRLSLRFWDNTGTQITQTIAATADKTVSGVQHLAGKVTVPSTAATWAVDLGEGITGSGAFYWDNVFASIEGPEGPASGLSMKINVNANGTTNDGELSLHGFTNGVPDLTRDGYIYWNGEKITVPRDRGDGQSLTTGGIGSRQAFIMFDTAKPETARFVSFGKRTHTVAVYKNEAGQWLYDNNEPPQNPGIPFTPIPGRDVALGWLDLDPDFIKDGGLFGAPVGITVAAFPGANRTAEQSVNLYHIDTNGIETSWPDIVSFAVLGPGALGFNDRSTVWPAQVGLDTGDIVSGSAEIWSDDPATTYRLRFIVSNDAGNAALAVLFSPPMTGTAPARVSLEGLSIPATQTGGINRPISLAIVKDSGTGNLFIRKGMINRGPVAAPYAVPSRGISTQSVNLYPVDSDGVEAFASVGTGSQGMDWTSAGNGPGDDPLRTILATDIGAVPGATRVSQSAEIWTDEGQEVWLRVSFAVGQGFGTIIKIYESQKVTSKTPTFVKIEGMTWPLGATRMWAQIVKIGAGLPAATLHMRRFMANLGPIIAPYAAPSRGAERNIPSSNLLGPDAGPEHTVPAYYEYKGFEMASPMPIAKLGWTAGTTRVSYGGMARFITAGSGFLAFYMIFKNSSGATVSITQTETSTSLNYTLLKAENILVPWGAHSIEFRGSGSSFTTDHSYKEARINFGARLLDFEEPPARIGRGEVEDGATKGASWLDNLKDRPLELTDGRIPSALSPIGRLWDSRRATQSLVGGAQSVMTASPVSATQNNGVATIFVAAHSRYYDFGAVSYNGGSIGGLSTSTTYYVYADDPDYVGGAALWQASTSITNAIAPGRIYLGRVTTPATASGSGGGTTEPPPDDCVATTMFLSDGRTAGDIQPGDLTDVMDNAMQPLGLRPVISNTPAQAQCIRLVTKSAQVVVSASAPVVTAERGTLRAVEICGLKIGVLIDGVFSFETVETILPEGSRAVARIRVGGISYAAGTRPGRLIFTHNPFFKP